MAGLRILLADDHAVMRQALALALSQGPRQASVIEADRFRAAADLATSLPDLDLAILDLYMPDANPQAGVDMVRRARPDLPLIVLSGSGADSDIEMALGMGVMGYIPKSAPRDVLDKAMDLVLAGFRFRPQEPIERASSQPAEPRPCGPVGGSSDSEQEELAGGAPDAPSIAALSGRQREILDLMARGQTNKDIARTLGLSPSTVKTHVEAILRILRVTNRTQAVRQAMRRLA